MSVHAAEAIISRPNDLFDLVIADLLAGKHGTTLQQNTDSDPIFQCYQTALDAVLHIRSVIADRDRRQIASNRGEFQPVLDLHPVNFKKED